MAAVPTFEEYLSKLGRLSAHIDPTASTPEAEDIKEAADNLTGLTEINIDSLSAWVKDNPSWTPVLGIAVGLSQEKLKNSLRDEFNTSGWLTLARSRSEELIEWLDRKFDLLRLLIIQRERDYSFGDVLVARAGSRVTATQAGVSGRKIEDEIEAIARDLGLEYQVRTRFTGRKGDTAPCDLVVPSSDDAQLVVAAKGFDSTGSKLTDAVREIQEMAAVRKPNQYVMAVVDGIGWKSRVADLKRIHKLWVDDEINGLYTLATLDDFRDDLENAAKLRSLI